MFVLDLGHLPKRYRETVPHEMTLHLVLPIYDTVAFIHSKNLVHKDIKPGNIFITYDGTQKLGDFGLCDFSGEDGYIDQAYYGTKTTMAPEFMDGKRYNHKIDAWALAATFLLLHQHGREGYKYYEDCVEIILDEAPADRQPLLYQFSGVEIRKFSSDYGFGPERENVFSFAGRILIWDLE